MSLAIPLPPPSTRIAAGPARCGVAVCAPGRLHLGFLDPAATLGRRFGSLGLVIDGFATELRITTADKDLIDAADAPARAEIGRAAGHLDALRSRTGRRAPLHLHLLRVLPAHAGLGSGTQLALAVGRGFAAWHGLDLSTPLLAGWLGRGLRSGVGIAGFDRGGLLLDGGPGAHGVAPLLARVELPAEWRVLVVIDPRQRGLSGAAEREAIAGLPPLPQAAAAELCHQVLMRVLPGAAEGDFAAFASGLSRMQQLLGAHFAPAQGGRTYASAAVERLMLSLQRQLGPDGAAIGQSSWGPTAFAILPGADRAQAAVQAARAAGVVDPALALHVVRARPAGAVVGESAPATRGA